MTALYDQIVEITRGYLGPAAERFVVRQVRFHLDKNPDELVAEDLPKIAEWGRVTLGLLTSDRKLVDEYADRLKALAEAFDESSVH